MKDSSGLDRRNFLRASAAGLTGVILAGCSSAAKPTPAQPDVDVAPPEDLMREHGVLRRVLLAYEEILRRLDAKTPLPAGVLKNLAGIIRTFIEDYHEKLEEDHIFPLFEKAGKEVELTKTLRAQHEAGRKLTETVLLMAAADTNLTEVQRGELGAALRMFIRMYRPHASREDTVLFPALRTVVSPAQFDKLGDQFEDKEHELFGPLGFEKMVLRVAEIEKTLGINALADFTPQLG